jgi:DNA-binding transcriptional ArsR family regulator
MAPIAPTRGSLESAVVTHSEKHHEVTIRDPQVMRAMAHPARLAILDYLNDGHEATATECARVCGLSPSATSYHLRALAKAGLVEEAPGRGDGRERVWRSSVGNHNIDADAAASSETVAAALALVDVILARDDQQARRWFDRATSEPKEWFDAATVMRSQLVVTPQELTELAASVAQLLHPYTRGRRKDSPPEARPVAAMFRAVPSG